jgi:lipopolysaccharide assembly outer membrane protein LptD (OstA)
LDIESKPFEVEDQKKDSSNNNLEQKETSIESFEFTLSRGCPIRHLPKVEVNKNFPIMLAPKHEGTTDEEQIQVTFPPQGNSTYIPYEKVSELAYVFQDMVQLFLGLWSIFHFHVVVQDNAKNCIFCKKGSYFIQIVNGFI